MRQMLCPVLVGLEAELEVLLDALDRAAGGHGGTFFVMGEAGVGKSRLVHEVSRRALSRGLPVLTGRAVSGSVPEWLPREPAPGVESPVVLGEGLLRLLRALAGERGCLLVLADLHWADPESLAVLEHLADNVAAERIVCLGTLRTEMEGAGRELIGALVDRRAARVSLPRRRTLR